MSVQRFKPASDVDCGFDEFDKGDFVLFDDYARLEREKAALAAELASLAADLAELRAKGSPLPDGWVAVPARLTAENGAKSALIGEFYEVLEHECTECDEIDEDETCDICGGSGIVAEKVPVSWSTIKQIHSRMVELFSARPNPNPED